MTASPVSLTTAIIPRGLAHARQIKDHAREEYKRKQQLCAQPGITKQFKKNHSRLSPNEKYRRRLQKNQESAAAARYAHDAYMENLEFQVRAYDIDMTNMERREHQVQMQRNKNIEFNALLNERSRRLQTEIQHLRAQLDIPTNVETALLDRNNDFASHQQLPIPDIEFPFSLDLDT